jgi:hypothetical protein
MNGKPFLLDSFFEELFNTKSYFDSENFDSMRIGKEINNTRGDATNKTAYKYLIGGDGFFPRMLGFYLDKEKENDDYVKEHLTKRYNDIINVYQFLQQKKQKNGMMGKVIFGQNRGLLEPNLPVENNLFNSLDTHVNNNVSMKEKFTNIIKTFLQNGFYKDFIKPPDTQVIFRGMTINKKTLSGLVKTPIEDLQSTGEKVLEDPIVFKPRHNDRPSTSWSKSLSRATMFANRNLIHGENFGIVLFAKSVNNPDKLFDLKQFYKEIDSEFDVEEEVIGLGEISVYKVKWKKVNS